MIATTGTWPALWNTESGKLVGHLTAEGEYSEFGPAAFDDVRGWVLMGSRDGRVYAWDTATAELRGKSDPAGAVDSIAVLKNSPWIAFAMAGAPIHLWNPETGETRVVEALPYSNVVAGREPGSILFGNYAGSVELWNAETGEVLSRFTLR
jgi:WD40 repeat protein